MLTNSDNLLNRRTRVAGRKLDSRNSKRGGGKNSHSGLPVSGVLAFVAGIGLMISMALLLPHSPPYRRQTLQRARSRRRDRR